MGKAMRFAAYAIALVFCGEVNAQCPAETSLFFGNGMFNSNQAAKASLDALRSRIHETGNWKPERTFLAFKNRSIIVVAHSQGNFFANNASLILQNDTYPATENFKIISVATPASFVNDGGPYFTLKSDGVIKWIPQSLAPNVSNLVPTPGNFDHLFVKHYLKGLPTGEKIIAAIESTLRELEEATKVHDQFNADCWNWFESLSLKKGERTDCTLKCNIAKSDMSNFSCSQLCESYCGCSVKRANARK